MDQDPIVQCITQNPPDVDRAASLLIHEMMEALEQGRQVENYLLRENLVNVLIESDTIAEEYAQRLLRLKLAYYLNQHKYTELLGVFDCLSNSEGSLKRLVCCTADYFKLLLLKAQALIATENYDLAYEYIQEIRDVYFKEPLFNELPDPDTLVAEYLTKQALAAHLSTRYDHEAYPLFKLIPLEEPNFSNANVFVMFGYECREREKYQEASEVFQKLYSLMLSKEHKNKDDLELFREVTAMCIITSTLALKKVDPKVQKQYNDFFTTSPTAAPSPLSRKMTILKAQVERFSKEQSDADSAPFNPFLGPLFETSCEPLLKSPSDVFLSEEDKRKKPKT